MILVYSVISMTDKLAHMGSCDAPLGKNPSAAQVQEFSNELHVSERTPPTLLLHASDDSLVDVDNSVVFYEALPRQGRSPDGPFSHRPTWPLPDFARRVAPGRV